MSESIKEIVKRLEKTLGCNCDLDNWQRERLTGHSCVCRIHMKAVSEWKP